jgi:hypothetical protein
VHVVASKAEHARPSSSPARTERKLSTGNRYAEHVSVKGPSMQKFVKDFVAVWVKVTHFDRFDRA